MIKEIFQKVKPFYILFLILVLGSIFLALWRISALENRHTPIQISYPGASSTGNVLGVSISPRTLLGEMETMQASEVIGSKTGKKYYFPWCGTVNRIKPENQIHFASIDDAKSAGYVPAANCKGLK